MRPLIQVKTSQLYTLAAVLSLVVSLIIYAQNQPFNSDGILYLYTAKTFLDRGFTAAIHVFNWPLYSILIALTSKATSLSLIHAAYILQTFLITATVCAYLLVVKELGADQKTLRWALLCILVFPYINHLRDSIIRDFGYHALGLISLYFFIRYCKLTQWRDAIAWNLTIMAATLFRIEGGVLLLLAPFATLVIPSLSLKERGYAFAKLYSVILLCIIALYSYLLLSQGHTELGRLPYLIPYLMTSLSSVMNSLGNKVILLNRLVFNFPGYGLAPFLLLGGMPLALLFLIAKEFTAFFTAVVLYSLCRKMWTFDQKAAVAFFTYFSLTLIIPTTFFIQRFFLPSRYLCLFFLIALTLIPFALSQISKTRYGFAIVALFLAHLTISSLYHFGPSKTYLKEAGLWVAKHAEQNTLVYSNNQQLAFWIDRKPNLYPLQEINNADILKAPSTILQQPYQYAAIQIPRRSPPHTIDNLSKTFHSPPIKTFTNNKGDRVVIYQLNKLTTKE